MLKIYSKETTIFTNNGIGILKDYISNPIITEVLNGEYTLEFEYSKQGNLADKLVEENIVKANGQLFRICLITKTLKTIKVLAKHIVFDLSKNFLIDIAPTDKTGSSAIDWILSNTQFAHDFTSWSDVPIVKSARYVRKNVIESLITTDNSLVKIWGGELEFDNTLIKLHSRRGQNRGLVIRYGKNLNGVEYQLDFSTVVTRIMPQGSDELLLPEEFIDSPLINNYATPIIKKIDFDIGVDEDINQEQALEQLRQAVLDLYENGIDKPKISIKVDFIELSKVTEYKQYSNLERACLGDTIKFIIPDLNLNFETRIVKTEYDCVNDRFIKFELGTIVPNFVNQNSTKIDIINKNLQQLPINLLQQAKDNATLQIVSAFVGGNRYMTENETFYMDTDDINTAQKIWRWNLNGLGYSSTGIDGPYGLAMTQDGKIVADFITTGTMSVERITGLAGKLSSIDLGMENITTTVQSNTQSITDLNTTEKIASGTDIALTDSAEAEAEITGFECESAQLSSVQGKNMFDLAVGSVTVNGVTCTTSADGTITLNGTTTASCSISLSGTVASGVPSIKNRINMTSGLKYTVSRTIISGTASFGSMAIVCLDTSGNVNYPNGFLYNFNFNMSSQGYQTITAGTPNGTNWSSSLLSRGLSLSLNDVGIVYTNFKFKIQYEQSDVSTAWQTFTPNSPSPDYPNPILSTGDGGLLNITSSNGVDTNNYPIILPEGYVGGSLPNGVKDTVEYVKGGKNLIPPTTKTAETISGVTFTPNADGSITINGTATANADFYLYGTFASAITKFIIPKTDNYTLKSTRNGNVTFYLGYNSTITMNTNISNYTKNLTANTQISFAFVRVLSGQTVSNLTIYPQLEPGSNSTKYIPYSLISGNKFVKRINEALLSGTVNENWILTNTYTNTYRFDVQILVNGNASAVSEENLTLSDKIKTTGYGDSTDTEHIRTSNTSFYEILVLFINKGRLTTNTVTALKTYLASNPITVQYQLAEPIYYDAILPTVQTYLNNTNITTLNTPKATLNLKYIYNNILTSYYLPKIQESKTSADLANFLLAEIVSDNKLTPDEKQVIKKEWDVIVSEVILNDAQATSFEITTEKTTYDTAYSTLNIYISPLLTDLTATSDVVGATLRSNFKNYYDARTNLLNATQTKLNLNVKENKDNLTVTQKDLSELKQTAKDFEMSLTQTGGFNLIPNSMLRFGLDKYATCTGTVSIEQYKEIIDNTICDSAIKINNGSVAYNKIKIIANELYTFSTIIYKMPNANVKVTITSDKVYEYIINCEDNVFVPFEFPIQNSLNFVEIKLECDNNYALFADCILNKGTKLGYQPFNGEFVSQGYLFGTDGFEITNSLSKTKQVFTTSETKIVNVDTGKTTVSFNGDNTELTKAKVTDNLQIGHLRKSVADNGHIIVIFSDTLI